MSLDLILQIIAAVTGVGCVYLQTQEKILAWPLGIISVGVSIYVFYTSRLYSDVLLHVVYVVLNIYGWWNWVQKRQSEEAVAPILQMQRSGYLLWTLVIAVGTLTLGTLMQRWFGASLSYFDAFTTVGSFVAQFLLARKVMQNWTLWIIVDIVAINIYIYKGIYIIAALFAVYLVLCIKGYFDWRKSYRLQAHTTGD